MSRPRFEKMDAERQKRLFESTAKEFAAHGFDGASLNLILEQSGMSKSSLYYYFDDKADLFTTMIERAIAVFFKEVGCFLRKSVALIPKRSLPRISGARMRICAGDPLKLPARTYG
jgi:AcrR family transcriptional regulator